mmetsp:Transcript_2201/g.5148  ORF Transcript_2201/g.5148 Transcript_2201/m.5148 type:complete len:285 (-) Transcript_2201:35-889(-)
MAPAPSTAAQKINVTTARYAAYVSATLGFGATIFLIIQATANASDPNRCSFQSFQSAFSAPDADPTCLLEFWKEQRETFGVALTFDLLEAVGALLVIPVIMVLSEMFGSYYTESKFMTAAFVFAFAINVVELCVRAGERGTSDFLTSWPLGTSALQSVTLTYIQVRGMFSWLFAMDELVFGIGLVFASILAFRTKKMPTWHNWLGLVTGVLAMINFLLELGRLGSWFTFSVIAGISMAVVGFILFPIWIVTVGCYLDVVAPLDSRSDPLMSSTDDATLVPESSI